LYREKLKGGREDQTGGGEERDRLETKGGRPKKRVKLLGNFPSQMEIKSKD